MSRRDRYQPGPATGAELRQKEQAWTLVLVRDLRHPPSTVWQALTDPTQLREWAPFDADRPLGTVGAVTLSTVGTPSPVVSASQVKRAVEPTLLELTWGEQELKWELEPLEGDGTRLTLWHGIDKRFSAMGAAGWHICLDVLGGFLSGEPLGRLAGPEAMTFDGWQRLAAEYAKQFGLTLPPFPGAKP